LQAHEEEDGLNSFGDEESIGKMKSTSKEGNNSEDSSDNSEGGKDDCKITHAVNVNEPDELPSKRSYEKSIKKTHVSPLSKPDAGTAMVSTSNIMAENYSADMDIQKKKGKNNVPVERANSNKQVSFLRMKFMNRGTIIYLLMCRWMSNSACKIY